MGGDDFNKADEAKPYVEWGDEGTLLSRLQNQHEFSKIRHDAAEEYFEELCSLIEKIIKTQHNFRTYFLFIRIHFPPNLNKYVSRPKDRSIDFLMQKTWPEKFQAYMKENQINCQKIAKSDCTRHGEIKLTIKHSSKKSKDSRYGRLYNFDWDSLKFRNDVLIKSDEITATLARQQGFEDDDFYSGYLAKTIDIQNISQEYIMILDGQYGFRIEFEVDELSKNQKELHIRLCENFSIGYDNYPPGYFSGLTLSERENIEQRVSGTESVGFLLTWPKHVFVDSKGTHNDYEYPEEY